MFKWKNILIFIFRRKTVLWFIAIIAITLVTRFFQIEELPPGLNNDEVSQGYNAFSLSHTGKDRYGQNLPILFKSYYSFQAPLYTYFTIIPIYFLGNSILSVRTVSIISGIILVAITFLLLKNFEKRKNIATLTALTLCLAPWAVFFSRIGTEASLGLALFALSFLIFYLSLKRLSFFPLATFILGLSTHAYYSERVISILFLIAFSLLFKNTILSNKKIFIIGLSLFVLTQLPHLLIANTEAFTRRIDEVNYFTDQYFQNNSGQLHYFPFGRPLFIIREFLSQYLTYFSPKNLFFDPDPQPQRSTPNLSVFYNWMLVPFLLGIGLFFKRRSVPLIKMLVLAMLIGPIPASLTRDPFYTLRTLIFLWTITIMIAFGINEILSKLHLKFIKFLLISILLLYSSFSLYISYFILFKYERTSFDYSYMKLLKKIAELPEKKFVVDNSRHIGMGVRIAFFNRYNPHKLQQLLKSKAALNYYSTAEVDESYILDNIQVKPINWGETNCQEYILVGDLLSISSEQVKDHNLSPLFDIKDMAGDVSFRAYLTNPDASCSLDKGKT